MVYRVGIPTMSCQVSGLGFATNRPLLEFEMLSGSVRCIVFVTHRLMPSMNTLDIPSFISDQVLGWYDGFNPIILFEVYGLSPNLPNMVGSWSPVMILVFEVHYFIHVRLRFQHV